MESRREVGLKYLLKLAGESGLRSMEELEQLSPNLGKYALEFGYGDIYSNSTLDLKQRALITLSSLITQGDCEPELIFHFKAALNIGLTKEEVLEVITHCSAYAGFPRAINALFIFNRVLNE